MAKLRCFYGRGGWRSPPGWGESRAARERSVDSACDAAGLFTGGLRVPEIGRRGGNIVRRIAELCVEAVKREDGLLNRLGVHLQEFLVAFFAQNVFRGRVIVEAPERAAEGSDVVHQTFVPFHRLRDEDRL